MAKRLFKSALSLPWYWRTVFGIALLVMLCLAAPVAKRFLDFNTEQEFYLYSLIAILLVTLLSAFIGGLSALFMTSHIVHEAEEKVNEQINRLSTQAKQFETISQNTSTQLQESHKCINLLHEEISRVQEIVKVALERFSKSIIDYHGLMGIEDSVRDDGEIWVLTSALELEGDELEEIIFKNLQRGIRYKYLIPKEEWRLKKKMQDLAEKWESHCSASPTEQIQCYLVPKHFAYMTVIIYEPYNNSPTVLVKFPKSDVYEKDKYPFIYKVDNEPEDAWKTFVDAIQELMDGEKNICGYVETLSLEFSENKYETK